MELSNAIQIYRKLFAQMTLVARAHTHTTEFQQHQTRMNEQISDYTHLGKTE